MSHSAGAQNLDVGIVQDFFYFVKYLVAQAQILGE